MKTLCFFLLFLVPSICVAQSSSALLTFKLQFEASADYRQKLLERLNAQGKAHLLRFTPVNDDFDFRIVFETGQGSFNIVNVRASDSVVFDSEGHELFEVKRRARWTDSGATNAAAKEIIKRLLRLTSVQAADSG